jgi:hypothetical protein
MNGYRVAINLSALVTLIALAACSTGVSSGPGASPPKGRDVDVYFLLDTSPSMEFPATSAGVASLKAATQVNERGCSLGCHQSETSALQESGCAAVTRARRRRCRSRAARSTSIRRRKSGPGPARSSGTTPRTTAGARSNAR